MHKGPFITVGSFAVAFAALGLMTTSYRTARAQESLDSYQYSREAQQGKLITPVKVNLMGKDPNLVYIGSYLVNGQGGCNGCHTCPSYSGTNPYVVGGPGLPVGSPPGGNQGGNSQGGNQGGNSQGANQGGNNQGGNGPGSANYTPVNTNFFLGGGTPFPNAAKSATGGVLTAPNITPNSAGLPGGLSYADFKSAMQNGIVSTQPGHVLQVMPWPTLHNLYENDLVAIYQYLSAIPPAQSGACTGAGQTGP